MLFFLFVFFRCMHALIVIQFSRFQRKKKSTSFTRPVSSPFSWNCGKIGANITAFHFIEILSNNFSNHPGLVSTTIPLNVSIIKTSESCSKWIFIPCFHGDMGNHCERCTEGSGFEYTVTWNFQDGSVEAGDNVLIKWGPGMLWTNEFMVISTISNTTSSGHVVVPSVCFFKY